MALFGMLFSRHTFSPQRLLCMISELKTRSVGISPPPVYRDDSKNRVSSVTKRLPTDCKRLALTIQLSAGIDMSKLLGA
jgi:hypothetical protein